MVILRGVVASSLKSIELESLIGFPFVLSVDPEHLADSWVLKPVLSPSTELKLRAGVYGESAKETFLSGEYGKRQSSGAIKALLTLREDKYAGNNHFGEVSMSCEDDLKEFLLNVFQTGRKSVDILKARRLAHQAPSMSQRDFMARLGEADPRNSGRVMSDWMFYDPSNLIDHYPNLGAAYMQFTVCTVKDILYKLGCFSYSSEKTPVVGEVLLEYMKNKVWR